MRRVVFVLLCLMVLFIPIEEVITIDSVGSLIKVIGIIAVAAYAVYSAMTWRAGKLNTILILSFLFATWATLSNLWTLNEEFTWERTPTMFLLAAFIYMLYDIVSDEKELKIITASFCIGATILAISCIHNYMQGKGISEGSDVMRYSGMGENPNRLAVYMAFAVMFWAYSVDAFVTKRRYIPILTVFYVLMAVSVVVMTGSRNGFVGMIEALIYLFFFAPSITKRGRATVAILFVFVGLLIFGMLPRTNIERLGDTANQILTGTLTHRTEIWAAAVPVIDKHLFLGVGLGSFNTATRFRIWVAHNSFIAILTELGAVGLGIFLTILALAVSRVVRRASVKNTCFFVALFITWATVASVADLQLYKITWLMLAFSLILTKRDFMWKSVTTSKAFG